MRVVALDLGSRRVGVAVSDAGGRLASPHATVARTGDADADVEVLAGIVTELGAQRVVVGLPLSLDGSDGRAARTARAEALALAERVSVPVETHDERLTTVTAQRQLREAHPRRSGRARRRVVDQSAAAVLLQSWLDAHR
ncbi:MAG: Holliday junction resolvase RuvX [Acidimicrobiales bacterium]